MVALNQVLALVFVVFSSKYFEIMHVKKEEA